MGNPTVVFTGRAGNKFVHSATDKVLKVNQPASIARLAGRYNIFELNGTRYKQVKGVVMAFLKPECLQEYIPQMDKLTETQLIRETRGRDTIFAVPFMKRVTFNLTCNLLFGIHVEPTIEALFEDFAQTFKGFWCFLFNVPGTAYCKAIRARARIAKRMAPIVERKRKLSGGEVTGKDDLISVLFRLRGENGEGMRDEEAIDNFVTLMIASHDISATLLSLMVWKMAREREIYHKVLEEQMEIQREMQEEKQRELRWSEVQKMKYTWRFAQELLRPMPPVFVNIRKAAKNLSFAGYNIPKGWQVFCVAGATHMDNAIFEDPEKFDPTRVDNPERPIPAFAYIPFGLGPRMCIGNEFARIETFVVMHHLVVNFEWMQVCPNEKITRKPFPYPSEGLPIKLTARENIL